MLLAIAGLTFIVLLLDDWLIRGLLVGLLELFGRTLVGREELTGLVAFGCEELGRDASGRLELEGRELSTGREL